MPCFTMLANAPAWWTFLCADENENTSEYVYMHNILVKNKSDDNNC